MNSVKKILILLLFCLTFSAGVADDTGDNKPVVVEKKIILLPYKPNPKRPNAPARTYIECLYCNQCIEFTFPEGVTSISVLLTNDEDSWMDVPTADNPIIYLSNLYGEYNLTCTTDDGREFYGILYF